LAGHFDEYPLWIARYNTREPTLACGRDWQFWQYGSRGKIEGISGNVDFNVFHGSLEQLDSLCYYELPVLSNALNY
jgi:lysozyme